MTSTHHFTSPGWVKAAVPAAAAVALAAHGLVHLMGVALLFHLGQPGALRYSDVTPAAGSLPGEIVGTIWFVAAATFIATATLILRHRRWRRVAAAAAMLSLVVLAPSAHLAVAGVVVDVAVLLVIATRARRVVHP